MISSLFSDCGCTVAEGPRWNAAERMLYWVDITEGAVLRQRADASPNEFERFSPGLGKIGAVEFASDGRLMLFTERCEVHVCGFGEPTELAARLDGGGDRRFNDVVDAGCGVFFCGVAPKAPGGTGELWRFDAKSGKFDVVEESVAGMPNGMAISPDRRTLYFVVSDEKVLYAYDFDDTAKTVSGRRVVCSDFAEPGIPDGMCVDHVDGSLYIAMWNGFRLEHRSADGKMLETFRFPMAKVTSACIGDGHVYVTTGNLPRSEAEREANKAGGVFVIKKGEVLHGKV